MHGPHRVFVDVTSSSSEAERSDMAVNALSIPDMVSPAVARDESQPVSPAQSGMMPPTSSTRSLSRSLSLRRDGLSTMGGVSFRRAGSLASLPATGLPGVPPDSTRPAPRPLQRARLVLLAFMSIAALAFGGATFGWGPMQLILRENGKYGYLCEPDGALSDRAGATALEDSPTCPEQTSSLLLVSTATSFLFVTAPFWGFLIDRGGPFLGILISSILVWTGLSILAVASFFSRPGVDHLLFLSFTCLMLVSVMSNMLFIHVGLVFDDSDSIQRAISLLNTLFDAGALTYLLLYQISLAVPSSVPNVAGWVFMGYLGLSVFVYGGAVWAWRRLLKEKEKAATNSGGDGQDDKALSNLPQTSPEPIMEETSAEGSVSKEETEMSPASKEVARRRSSIRELPPPDQLKSRLFILHAIYFGIVSARNTFVLTTAGEFLKHLGDEQHDYLYLKIFTFLQPASILGVPFMNWMLSKYEYHVSLQFINLLGIAHGIIQVSSMNLNVQVFGFIIFSIYRCFVFSVCFGFLPTYMGSVAVGRGAGLLTFSQGIGCLVNIPLTAVSINVLDGDFFWSNLAYTLLFIPCVAISWVIGKDNAIDKQKRESSGAT